MSKKKNVKDGPQHPEHAWMIERYESPIREAYRQVSGDSIVAVLDLRDRLAYGLFAQIDPDRYTRMVAEVAAQGPYAAPIVVTNAVSRDTLMTLINRGHPAFAAIQGDLERPGQFPVLTVVPNGHQPSGVLWFLYKDQS